MLKLSAVTRNKKYSLMAVGVLAVSGAMVTTFSLQAKTPATAAAPVQAPVVSTNVTEADVVAAQQAWVAALVQIAKDYDTGGHAKAKQTAETVLDSAYGYGLGPVLFKPTLTTAPHTFRPTRDGALAYFVGGDASYPNDQGFALKGWVAGEVKNVGIHLHGNSALSMGNVVLTDKQGNITTVDKTWGYVRDESGQLRIVLHHSSLPVGS